MMRRLVILILVAAAIVVGAMALSQQRNTREVAVTSPATPSQPVARPVAPAPKVPRFEMAPRADSLEATLSPAKYVGKTKQAYEVAGKIPLTLAQLPCYCHCDQTVGHKSLHSCFVDEHAASCAVCVDEALLAYKLEKEDKLTPEQVREVIIEKYSGAHAAH